MKYKTFKRRQTRFYRIDAILNNRAIWHRKTYHKDGSISWTCWNKKQWRQWCIARKLYYDAYLEFMGEKEIPQSLSVYGDTRYPKKEIPSGRSLEIITHDN